MDIRKSTRVNQTRVTGKINSKVVTKQSIERKKNKKKKNIFRIITSVVMALILIIILRANFLRITEVVISENISAQDREKVNSIVQNILQKKYLFVIPESNIFIAHSEKIEDVLAENVSGITNISVDKKGLKLLVVSAEPREPVFKVIGFDQIYIDANGTVFEKKTDKVSTSTIYISENSLALSGDIQSLPVGFDQKVGSVIDEQYFNNINKTVRSLKAKNFMVTEVVLYPYKDAEFVLENGGGKIRINMNDDIDEVINIFSSAKKIEPLRSAASTKTNIEYIDLRFGNKVFFKLKQ